MGRERTSRVPWHIEQTDLCAANDGHVEFTRDLLVEGKSERHLALHVVGQFDRGLSLGLIAIRCQRQGSCCR